MNIYLISPSSGNKRYAPPLGLLYIGSVLKEQGHKVTIIDRANSSNPELELCNPDIVGISAMTIQIKDAYYIAKLVKDKFPETIIAFGGYHVSAEPILTMQECPEIDIACKGEGEDFFLSLADGENYESIPNSVYRKDGNIIINDFKKITSLKNIPLPHYELLNMGRYTSLTDEVIAGVPVKAFPIINSRGCYYHCNFCASDIIHKQVRFHSVEYVIENIEYLLKNYKFDAFNFVDSMFLGNRAWAESICNEIIKRKLKIKWACSVRADSVDKDILKLMKQAGCFYINYGLESGSQRMLDDMNKHIKLEKNYEAVKLTNKAGILVNSAFLVNIPNEIEQDIEDTIRFLKTTNVYCAGINNLLPLTGSVYYKRLLESGKIKYSEKLWGEIGVLQPTDKIEIFSDIDKDKFIGLTQKANKIISQNNLRHYFSRNFIKHPLMCLKKVI